MLEVVAGIDHAQKVFRRYVPAEAERQLRLADAAAQRDDEVTRHRNRSSDAGRIIEAAGAAAADQLRPRTSTTGCASSACPISSDAAAATSSAKPTMLTCSLRPNKSGWPRRSITQGSPA